MVNLIYSIERDIVDPVFFAVVPDSFMNRPSFGRPASAPVADHLDSDDWVEQVDAPVVAPRDRWSF